MPSMRPSPDAAAAAAAAARRGYRMPPQCGSSEKSILRRFNMPERGPSEPSVAGGTGDRVRSSDQIGRRTQSSADPWATRPMSPFGRADIDPAILNKWCSGSSPAHGSHDSPMQLKWRPPPLTVSSNSVPSSGGDKAIVRLPDPSPPSPTEARWPEQLAPNQNARPPRKSDSIGGETQKVVSLLRGASTSKGPFVDQHEMQALGLCLSLIGTAAITHTQPSFNQPEPCRKPTRERAGRQAAGLCRACAGWRQCSALPAGEQRTEGAAGNVWACPWGCC